MVFCLSFHNSTPIFDWLENKWENLVFDHFSFIISLFLRKIFQKTPKFGLILSVWNFHSIICLKTCEFSSIPQMALYNLSKKRHIFVFKTGEIDLKSWFDILGIRVRFLTVWGNYGSEPPPPYVSILLFSSREVQNIRKFYGEDKFEFIFEYSNMIIFCKHITSSYTPSH